MFCVEVGEGDGRGQPHDKHGCTLTCQYEITKNIINHFSVLDRSGLGVAILAEAVQAVVMSLTAALAYEYVAPLLLGENKTRDGGESEAEQDSEEEAQTMFIRQFVSVQMASVSGTLTPCIASPCHCPAASLFPDSVSGHLCIL